MTKRCGSCSGDNVADARFCVSCGAMLEEAAPQGADPLIGKVLADRYRIVEPLGEGGMSRVYLAEQRMGTTSRKVAIKVLKLDRAGDPSLVRRFYQECETLVSLSHPNTIQVHDFGELPDGALYIVMEHVQGRSLDVVLADEGPLPPDRVRRIVAQICGSLEDAHQRGIVHRDLKPENVIIADQGPQRDFVKLLDFGIAKRLTATDGAVTQQGLVLGTPQYMSPEQFQGGDVDPRTDIYALGMMIYQLLTGAWPFEASSAAGWAVKHTEEQPRPIDAHPAAAVVPDAMKETVMRALAKRPDQRPGSAFELLRELTGGEDPNAVWAGLSTDGAHAEVDAETVALPGRGPRVWPLLLAGAGAVVIAGLALGGYFVMRDEGSQPTPTPPPSPGGSADAGTEAADGGPDATKTTPQADPEHWFQSVHHVRNCSNAQNALEASDGQTARIRRRGILTLEIAPGRKYRADGTDAPDLIVHVPEGHDVAYQVEASRGHHHFRMLDRRARGTTEIDLDRHGIEWGRYVRIGNRHEDAHVRLDAVEARHPAESDHGH